MGEQKAFARESTGLVRAMSPHHVFIYNMMAVGLTGFTEAVLFSYAPGVLPGGDIGIGIITTVLAAIPFYLVVSMLAASMPRAGGDYVWQSRIISPAIGFAATFSAWTVWQWFFGAFLGSVMVTLGLQPFLALLGQATGSQSYSSLAVALESPNATFVITTVILVLGFLITMRGMRFYVRLQYILFGAALLSLLTMIGLLLTHTHQQFVSSFDAAMLPVIGPNAYQNITSSAVASGVLVSPAFSASDTVVLWAIVWLSMGYAAWSIYNLGEIKRAGSLKLQLFEVVGSLLAIGSLWAVTWYAYSGTVGVGFIRAFNGLWFSGNPGPVSALLGVVPDPFFPYIVSLLTTNPVLLTMIFLGMIFGIFQVVLIIYFASTRIMLAAGMDRVLPARVASVSTSSGAPLATPLIALVGSEVWLYFVVYQFNSIGSYVATAGFGTEIAYLLLCATAIVYPLRRRESYDSSPISRFRVGRLPAISVLGTLALLFNLFLTYEYVAGPNLFLTYPLLQSDEFVIGLFVACLLIYYASRALRKRQGIDLGLSYRELPPE
ncbi:MAG TPA: amino acid permease [Nitrososphaerales archaeon]|nr:amino acid permease [Nitrososphaerales archaeon]